MCTLLSVTVWDHSTSNKQGRETSILWDMRISIPGFQKQIWEWVVTVRTYVVNIWESESTVLYLVYNWQEYKNIPRWNDWCFRPRFCTCKAILVRVQHGLMRWIVLWIMPWCRIDRSICWSAVQRVANEPRMPPYIPRWNDCKELYCTLVPYSI